MDCAIFVSNMECDKDKGLVLEVKQQPIKEDYLNLIMEDLCSGTKQVPSIEIHPQHLEFFIDHDGFGLIPVEMFDSKTQKNPSNL